MPTNGERARRIALAGAVLLLAFSPAVVASAQEEPPASPPPEWEATAIDYSNVPYPYPVEYLDIRLMGEDYRMAYMDVAPTGEPNGRTVVLFHGMNFFAAAFGPTIAALTEAGFRAIAVDRLGYGRSSKPVIHYNLHMPARHTKALLDELGIEQVA
ncbi:MAG: alpha/beta hydrolase, partial [Gammaproteobacteria bacterium]|nr:alpha/beta hydrolase [Gammaproteobacteria bacterium]